jgi:hypothetical protein
VPRERRDGQRVVVQRTVVVGDRAQQPLALGQARRAGFAAAR